VTVCVAVCVAVYVAVCVAVCDAVCVADLKDLIHARKRCNAYVLWIETKCAVGFIPWTHILNTYIDLFF